MIPMAMKKTWKLSHVPIVSVMNNALFQNEIINLATQNSDDDGDDNEEKKQQNDIKILSREQIISVEHGITVADVVLSQQSSRTMNDNDVANTNINDPVVEMTNYLKRQSNNIQNIDYDSLYDTGSLWQSKYTSLQAKYGQISSANAVLRRKIYRPILDVSTIDDHFDFPQISKHENKEDELKYDDNINSHATKSKEKKETNNKQSGSPRKEKAVPKMDTSAHVRTKSKPSSQRGGATTSRIKSASASASVSQDNDDYS